LDKQLVNISLNSPDNRNALSKYLIEDLQFVIETVKGDKDIYAGIVDSKVENTFCSGADLKQRIKMTVPEVTPLICRLKNS
jgi:methylglutaconyl-CoA hydratase